MCDRKDLTLLPALSAIIQTFEKYASVQGDKDKLCKAELKALIQTELAPMIKEAKGGREFEELFNAMDLNKDQEVDFLEFMSALALCTCICRGKSQNQK
ncbi:unnamed protein product [Knipowitschia caucasica]